MFSSFFLSLLQTFEFKKSAFVLETVKANLIFFSSQNVFDALCRLISCRDFNNSWHESVLVSICRDEEEKT